MLINTKTYPPGYKPKIFTAHIKVEYFDKKHQSTIENNPNRRKEYVKSFELKETILTLDDENLFPTVRMHDSTCQRAHKQADLKGKFHDYVLIVTQVRTIMPHGRVNYQFDQTKD